MNRKANMVEDTANRENGFGVASFFNCPHGASRKIH